MVLIARAPATGYHKRMPRRFDDPNKLTGSGAARRLGLKESQFYYLVRKGLIPRHVDKYYTQGYYLATELDEFARKYDEEHGTSPQ